MLVALFVIPGIGGDFPLHIEGVPFFYMLLHDISSPVPYHDPVPFGAANLFTLLIAPDLIGGQREISHESLSFPFRNPGHLAHIAYQRNSIYSVFHNALDLVTRVNVMSAGKSVKMRAFFICTNPNGMEAAIRAPFYG